MPVVTIPFDFEDLGDKNNVVPICINDTDRDGRKIAWGWITAVVPIADRLRSLARRRLDDVWRVSELTELSVHNLWYANGEDYGVWPQWRIYTQAKWTVEDLRYGGWRVRRGREVALGNLEATLRSHADHAADYQRREMVQILRQELLNSGQDEIADMMDQVLHGCRWDDVAVHLGEEPTKKNVNTLQRRFWRALGRFAHLL